MKSRKMLRYVAAGTAALVALSLAGCGGDAGSSGADAGSTADNGGSESKVITYSSLNYTADTTGNAPQTTKVEERFAEIVKEKLGYEIKEEKQLVHMGDYAEKLKVLFAGGDLPDVVHCGWFGLADLNKYGDQGLVVNFAEYKEQMPNMFSMIEGDSTFADRGYTPEGNLYIAPDIQLTPDGNYDTTANCAFRKDVLDEVGVKVPETLDELYDAAVALKAAYPDVYPIMTFEEWEPLTLGIFNAYNIPSQSVFCNGEEFVFAPFVDGYKESVEFLHKLYEEELIAPDYEVHTSEQGNAAIANGEAFLLPKAWSGYPAQWNEEYPDQEWVYVPGLRSSDEPVKFVYHASDDKIVANSSYYTVISSNSKVKDELMQIYDLKYTEDMQILFSWGIEGETYTVDENGERQVIEENFTDPSYGANAPGDISIDGRARAKNAIILYNGETIEQPLYTFMREVATPEIENAFYKDVTLSTDENEEYANIMTAVITYAEEQTAKFISGARSLDEWDAFIEELQDMGDIQKALDIKNSKLQ